MPVNYMPTSADINVSQTIGQLTGYNGSNGQFSLILGHTYPLTSNSTDFTVGPFFNWAGWQFFNLQISTNNASLGYVEIAGPYSIVSSSTAYIGGDYQNWEPYSGNIDIRATATYPGTFLYWYDIPNAITYYSNTVSFSPYDATIFANGYLVAVFV